MSVDSNANETEKKLAASDKKLAAARKKAPDFEKALASLEAVVEELEDGDLSLDAALKAFEKGVKLTQECQQALAEAEQKVAILLGNSPSDAPVPFEDESL